ncbi:MAG: type III pantothenate kinase, partial [Oscillospiraceae bacterium]|nr:type III pantothenate kinase [Oscillospiraceae bacterium]
MILAVDIGNTTVGICIIDNDEIIAVEKCMTDISEIEINYHDKITKMLISRNIAKIDGAVISSVVPLMTELIRNVISSEYGVVPLIVNYKTACNITIKTDEPSKVGSDRIADAVGAVSEYGTPLIIIDMGTATTVSVVNKD